MKTANILNELSYHDEKPQVTLLMETANTKELRICLQEGVEMKEHKAPFPIVVEVFQGEVLFGIGEEKYPLQSGMMVSLEGGVYHNLKAIKDSIVRLSISKSDQLERVTTLVK